MNCNDVKKESRISFSQLKIWKECAFKHKIIYIDDNKLFTGNEYTAFGTSIHTVCEHLVMGKDHDFEKIFKDELAKLSLPEINEKLVSDMWLAAPKIIEEVLPSLQEGFSEFEVFSVEEELCEQIDESENHYEKNVFKGFIDLVLKIDDTYHIIDWKTCSWGWNFQRRTDPMSVYQLIYYKHFFAKKHNIPEDKIKVHFGLLKRTAKKDFVEIFETTSGKKRIDNSLKVLSNAIHNIENKNFTKNKLSCNRCEYYKTEYCP